MSRCELAPTRAESATNHHHSPTPPQVLSQDETPFLYSIIFGEGVANDANSIVLFNTVQSLNFKNIDGTVAFNVFGTFLYLFFTSTALGIVLSHYHSILLQLFKLNGNIDYKSYFNTYAN